MRIEALGPEALAFISKAVNLEFPSGTTGLASFADDGELVAAVAFTPSVYGNSHISIAARKRLWASEEFIRAAARHGFEVLRNLRLSAEVEASNVPCLRLMKKLGFRLEGCMRGFDFGDLLIFGMRKEDCKWVSSAHQSHHKPSTPPAR